ncbi:MAG: 3'-5' exonuclease [Chloroflexota bacterium]
MAAKPDRIIVIDVEATCWEGEPPPGQETEIVEIGVCVLDVLTGERLAHESILVRPERSQVSPFCTQLTTLTPERVARGVTFEHACRILRRKYGAGDRAWASYGDEDRRLFEKQCAARGVPYPFGPTHLNVKALIALLHGLPREIGLPGALALLNLPVEGTPHRGVDDACNTARLLASLILYHRGVLIPS